jgi:hypothetical protein
LREQLTPADEERFHASSARRGGRRGERSQGAMPRRCSSLVAAGDVEAPGRSPPSWREFEYPGGQISSVSSMGVASPVTSWISARLRSFEAACELSRPRREQPPGSERSNGRIAARGSGPR